MVFQKLQPYLMADFSLIKLERGMGRGGCAAQVRLRSAAGRPSLIHGHTGTGGSVQANVDATVAREGQGRRCMQRLDVNPTAAALCPPSGTAGTTRETLGLLGPRVLTSGRRFWWERARWTQWSRRCRTVGAATKTTRVGGGLRRRTALLLTLQSMLRRPR
jgi:hypothetical protein